MTATSVHRPPRPNDEAEYRRLTSDDDWAQVLRVRILANATDDDPGFETFESRRVATDRATSAAGQGAWFGAFLDGRLVSQMGLAKAGPGLARFRLVETDPAYRGRGLAGTLVHHVSEYGFGELGATTLVMVADPDYLAVRIYRRSASTTPRPSCRPSADRPDPRSRSSAPGRRHDEQDGRRVGTNDLR